MYIIVELKFQKRFVIYISWKVMFRSGIQESRGIRCICLSWVIGDIKVSYIYRLRVIFERIYRVFFQVRCFRRVRIRIGKIIILVFISFSITFRVCIRCLQKCCFIVMIEGVQVKLKLMFRRENVIINYFLMFRYDLYN